VDHIDATADKLIARIVAEARGGKVLADVLSASLEYMVQAERQGFLLAALPPEAEAMPENLRGKTWVASDLQYVVAAWNTNLVKPEEAPTQLEDFADPRWKGRLIAEPRDVELLIALTRKLGSEEQAVAVLRRIAANDVEFHKGHSDLAELLAAGQAAACITCYSHHYPSRIRRGAPLEVMLTEGVGLIVGNGVMKDAPHPYTAMLWQRWAASEEGQQVYAEGGRTPALPSVAPRERNRPGKIYPIGPEDLAALNQFERTWKEIFQLR
jgi:ABC-type Fe3+ transport system substrate-binding protein